MYRLAHGFLEHKSHKCEWSAFSMSHYILTEKGGAATMAQKTLTHAKESQVPDFSNHDKTVWSAELKNDGSYQSPVFTEFKSYFNIFSVQAATITEKNLPSFCVSDEKQLASLKNAPNVPTPLPALKYWFS